MPAEVETMFYSGREVPWHGLGVQVENAPTSEDAIRLAGLDWNVYQTDVIDGNGCVIEGYKANLRDTDGNFLGMVGNRYKIVQNKDAFSFTDSLLGEGVKYETAGSLFEGKRIWLLAKMPETKILGDEVIPYLCFTNGHDGFNSVKVCLTPTRVVCANTLNFALSNAQRSWSTKHIGDISSKMEEAKHTLRLAENYMKELEIVSDQLANTDVSEAEVQNVLNNVFVTPNDASERVKENNEKVKTQFMVCMLAPDLMKFKGTAYQLAQAASDFATHVQPQRKVENYREKNFNNILNGHIVMDKVFAQLMQKVKTGEKITASI